MSLLLLLRTPAEADPGGGGDGGGPDMAIERVHRWAIRWRNDGRRSRRKRR